MKNPAVAPEPSSGGPAGGPARTVDVIRVGPLGRERRSDCAAAEEPLEIRVQGSTLLITMRTPGADRQLAAGLLLSERIVWTADDIGAIRHCTTANAPAAGNVVDVTLVGEAAERAATRLAGRRLVEGTSACGVCGRQSIDDLISDVPRVDASWTIPASLVVTLPDRLRRAQSVFDETGGLHAAALFDRDGTLMGTAEDVGRHNAVDKVVGAELLAGRMPLDDRVLFVSGRTSFEIVQKAVVAGIPHRGRRLRSVEPGHRPGALGQHHAARVRPRRYVQYLLGRYSNQLRSFGPFEAFGTFGSFLSFTFAFTFGCANDTEFQWNENANVNANGS